MWLDCVYTYVCINHLLYAVGLNSASALGIMPL